MKNAVWIISIAIFHADESAACILLDLTAAFDAFNHKISLASSSGVMYWYF